MPSLAKPAVLSALAVCSSSRYALLTGQKNSDIVNGKIKPGASPAQLCDLEADPRERHNVYTDHPKLVAGLKALLHQAQEVRKSMRPADK